MLIQLRSLAGLALSAAVYFACLPWAEAAPSDAFDAAPFGVPIESEAGKAYGLKWAENRKIEEVVVEFKETAPPAGTVKLEYWHRHWDGAADPVLAELNAGGTGWTAMDDWTNGEWKQADARVKVDNLRWTFTFAPSNEKEFPKLAKPGVTYRKTLRLRLLGAEALPEVAAFHAYTQSRYQPVKVRIYWGKPAEPKPRTRPLFIEPAAGGGRIEAYNGQIKPLQQVSGSHVKVSGDRFEMPMATWDEGYYSNPEGGAMIVEALMAVDPVSPAYDRTIITVRDQSRPFSFAADEVARGDRILIDDLGVLVVRADNPMTLASARRAKAESPGRTVYDRVAEKREQTLSRAWTDMPLRRPMFFPHGIPGNRNVVKQEPDGTVRVRGAAGWITIPRSPKDTERKKWPGEWLNLGFGLPAEHLRGGRELKDGYIPLLRAWWQEGPLYYEQLTIMDKLDGNLDEIQGDDPTLLLMRIRVVNTSEREIAKAGLRFTSHHDKAERLTLDGDRVIGHHEGEHVRYLLRGAERGSVEPDGDALRWSLELQPGEGHNLFFLIPTVTVNSDAELGALRAREFDKDVQRISAFWRKATEGSTQIQTGEPWLDNFYRSHLRHQLINCQREVGSDRLLAHVGTFHYGVFANESVMMLNDLECRGRHDLAERILETWLHYQGTVGLPGNFKSKDGIFYGAAGHEHGGYNKHHGYVMWGMAQHWWFTRDRDWMARAAPKLVKACQWVIDERKATMKKLPNGKYPIEYGLLPSGGLEDVQDYWYWFATNAATAWGFNSLAAALTQYGHPEGKRLQEEASAYNGDVLAAIQEARIRCPVVHLRDGTYVPKFPSEPFMRGRAYGWIRETLEGAMFFPVMGLVDPESPECTWILKDYEDNLYISDRYGYAIPNFESFWFSRGGFSMQAQLLDGPLPYLFRDEIKHFVRAYLNGFASAFEPDISMCNEHSLPELGYPAGDMFKTSDEAQSTYWLRLMFVRESGDKLYLGQAIPRYWLAGGKSVGITNAATYFGPMSLQISSNADASEIEAVLDPPKTTGRPPDTTYLRLRHPEGKPIRSVTVNGRPHSLFDKEKEWVVLPGFLEEGQVIKASY